jgi:hypothetical protein
MYVHILVCKARKVVVYRSCTEPDFSYLRHVLGRSEEAGKSQPGSPTTETSPNKGQSSCLCGNDVHTDGFESECDGACEIGAARAALDEVAAILRYGAWS